MGNLIDTLLVIVILTFLGLIVWSRVMNQTMYETAMELKRILADAFTGGGE